MVPNEHCIDLVHLIYKDNFIKYGGSEIDAKIEFNKGAALEDLNRGRGDEPVSIFSHQLGAYITVPRREAYKIEEGQLEAIKNNTVSGLDKTNMRGVLSEKYGHAKAYLYSTKQSPLIFFGCFIKLRFSTDILENLLL